MADRLSKTNDSLAFELNLRPNEKGRAKADRKMKDDAGDAGAADASDFVYDDEHYGQHAEDGNVGMRMI